MTIFLSFSAAIAADEDMSCSSIDLRNEQLQGKVEDLQQHSRGWCYAFAGAVSVAQVLGEQVSVMDIALNHSLNSSEKPLSEMTAKDLVNTNGGFVTMAVNDFAMKGFCSAKKLPWFSKPAVFLPNGSVEVRDAAVPLANSGISAEQLIKQIDKVCGQRKRINWQMKSLNFLPENGQVQNPYYGFSVVNEQLEQGLIPILQADYGLFSWARSGIKQNANSNHIVNIVGRRFNQQTKQCEYILRDSYLNQESILATKESAEGPYYKDGYMYATQGQITEYLGQIFYLLNANGNQNERGAYNVTK